MPIVVVARQPRGIQAQHQPRLPEANLGGQPLEAAAAVARRTGLPEVVINDLNPFLGPAEQGCTIDQPILQLGALLMLTDLAGGRLAHVNIGQLGAMRRRHRAFQIEQHVHRYAPRSNRRRRRRPALTGVAVPPASPAVVVLSVSSSATISAPRSDADPATPVRTAGSAVWPDASSNLPPGGEPGAHVFRQGKQGAYRHQREITIRPGITSCNVEICCLLRDPAMPTVRKNHPNPANAPTRSTRADFKPLTEQRMCGVDNPDPG